MNICLITHHQLVNNPRLYREADALTSLGHQVRVISVLQNIKHSQEDVELAQNKKWHWQPIDIRKGSWGYYKTGIRYKFFKVLWKYFKSNPTLMGLAYTRTFAETVSKASSQATDLLIAHTQPMLAPAYFAARKLGCQFSFDCEDILSQEFSEGAGDKTHQTLVRMVEKTFIPKARHVTVASPTFSEWLAKEYGIKNTFLVNNVPSLKESNTSLTAGYPVARDKILLHWFSQSIGFKRGIEDALRALPLIKIQAELHLRGDLLPEFKSTFESLIQELKIQSQVFIHERVAPGEIIRNAACYDIGLALMQPCSVNHELAVPNKLFFYMMAGLAVGATKTQGHLSILKDLPEIGFTYEPGNHQTLAFEINQLIKDPARLLSCRTSAFNAAKNLFNWEKEKEKYKEIIS